MTADFPEDSDNIVRYVGYSQIRENGRIDGAAFCRRLNEGGLSVNLLEFFADLAKPQQVSGVRKVIHRTLGRQAIFAELNIGDVKQYLRDELPDVHVINTPQLGTDRFPEPDPSHCEIIRIAAGGSRKYGTHNRRYDCQARQRHTPRRTLMQRPRIVWVFTCWRRQIRSGRYSAGAALLP